MRTDKDSNKLNSGTWMERLKTAGFQITDRGGGVLASKYGCGTVLEKTDGEGPRFAEKPGLLSGEKIGHLLDHGFQKFWQFPERMTPAAAEDLKALHRFEQELDAIIGVTSLYNQSLGTVSTRSAYDRVEGRERPKVHQAF